MPLNCTLNPRVTSCQSYPVHVDEMVCDNYLMHVDHPAGELGAVKMCKWRAELLYGMSIFQTALGYLGGFPQQNLLQLRKIKYDRGSTGAMSSMNLFS